MRTLAKTPQRVYNRGMKSKRIIRSFEDLLLVEWPVGVAQDGSVITRSGRQGLATWAGVGQTGITNWAGKVPPGYHYRMHLCLTFNGYVLDPITFGLGIDGYPAAARAVPKRAKV